MLGHRGKNRASPVGALLRQGRGLMVLAPWHGPAAPASAGGPGRRPPERNPALTGPLPRAAGRMIAVSGNDAALVTTYATLWDWRRRVAELYAEPRRTDVPE